MARRRKVDVITLGCSKNLVDSERLLKMLHDVGMQVRHDPSPEDEDSTPADIVIINTCGFIGDAKEESVNTILRYARKRTEGTLSRLYVMGCLSQRYQKELPAEIPEVDKWYGKTDWSGIVRDLTREFPATASYDRLITTPRHHAYLKISEGCNRFCAFCAIPLITGRHHSRPAREIIDEVKMLVDRGVKEFNVIAQDLSSYGTDIKGNGGLASLVASISDVPGVEWIRLHYAYPAQFPMDVLSVMAERQNVCKYIDIALQHASDKMLSAMRRNITRDRTERLLSDIRSTVPDIHIRTTMMTGFPGETDKDFKELMEFVGRQKFERLGAFAYSEEEDTFAAKNYSDSVPEHLKRERLDLLMALQEEISMNHQTEKVGRILKVMIDREEEDYFIGRTQWDSPEVDPEVLIRKSAGLTPGHFAEVKITEALPFELIGEKSDRND